MPAEPARGAAALMEAAGSVARLAGEVALRAYRSALAVERKPDGSPVTDADRAAERAAREWLEARFPRDAVLGEEFGERPGDSGYRWLLDPIDGTRSFVAGVPLWGTLVAVLEGDRVVAGAASFPAVEEHLVAGEGEGCWHSTLGRCRVSPVTDLTNATVLITDLANCPPERLAGWSRLASVAGAARTWGDCFGYLLLATGRAEVMADPRMHNWDAAALWPIIREAGGVVTDWDGHPTPFGGSVVATNLGLAEPSRRLLQSPAPAAGT